MTEGISSSERVSLNALLDIKSFFRAGVVISHDANKSEEENKSEENNKTEESAKRSDYRRSDVTRKALSTLLERSYNSTAESIKNNTEEEMQSNSNRINPVQIDTSALSNKTPLEIQRPEVKNTTNPIQADTSALSNRTPLEIKRPEVNTQTSTVESSQQVNVRDTKTATRPKSFSTPKQKNAILYELRNSMRLNYSARDIANKYGISYLEAQEIYVDLNRDKNGIVKESNLPKNSTVSYLV